MDKTIIIILIISLLVILLLVGILIFLIVSKKRNGVATVEKNNIDEKIITLNSKQLDVIQEILCESSNQIKQALNDLKHVAKFVCVSPKQSVLSIDKKISKALDDFKIDLYGKKLPSDDIILRKIKDIKILYSERSVEYGGE